MFIAAFFSNNMGEFLKNFSTCLFFIFDADE
jgi:hypothetical protein